MARRNAHPARRRKQWSLANREQRRRLIIDTAMELLQRYGISQVTIRRVAQRLGVGAMTLYTYVNGQSELRREITRRGMEMLHANCQARTTVQVDGDWSGGARAYIEFAQRNPNLYEVMFSVPLGDDPADLELMEAGFRPLVERVRERLALHGYEGEELDKLAEQRAAVYWVALHGLATLIHSGRIGGPTCNADTLLQDLLHRTAPD